MVKKVPGVVTRVLWASLSILSAYFAAFCLQTDGIGALVCFFFPVFLCLSSLCSVRLLLWGDIGSFAGSAAAFLLTAALSPVGFLGSLFALGGYAAALLFYLFVRFRAGREVGAICALLACNAAFYVSALIALACRKYGVPVSAALERSYDAFSGLFLQMYDELALVWGQMLTETGSSALDAEKIEKLREVYELYFEELLWTVPAACLSCAAVSAFLTVLCGRRLMNRYGVEDPLGVYRISNVGLLLFILLAIPGFFISPSNALGCTVHTVLSLLTLGMALQGFRFLYASASLLGKKVLCIILTAAAFLIFSQFAVYALSFYGMMGLLRLYIAERNSRDAQ